MNEITDVHVLSDLADVKIRKSTACDLHEAADTTFHSFPLWIKYTCLFAVKIALTVSAGLERRR